MTRFSKGTFDHDGDGKPGGSRKETDMATKKTAPKKTAAKKPPNPIKADELPNVAPAEGMDVQTGMEPGKSAKELRAEHNRMFAEADAKGQAALTEEAQVGLQVRGY